MGLDGHVLLGQPSKRHPCRILIIIHNVLLHYQHHISKNWRPILPCSYFWTFAQCGQTFKLCLYFWHSPPKHFVGLPQLFCRIAAKTPRKILIFILNLKCSFLAIIYSAVFLSRKLQKLLNKVCFPLTDTCLSEKTADCNCTRLKVIQSQIARRRYSTSSYIYTLVSNKIYKNNLSYYVVSKSAIFDPLPLLQLISQCLLDVLNFPKNQQKI